MPMQMSDLNNLMFVDPSQFMAGTQLRDQGLQAGELANQNAALQNTSLDLKNIFNQQNDPLLIQHQGLMNRGKSLDNDNQQMTNDVRSSTLDEEKEARRQKMVREASEDQLKTMLSDGQAMSLSPDPTKQAMGKRIYDASWAEVQRRAKAEDDQKKTETLVQGKKDVAGIGAGAKVDAAQIAAGARIQSAELLARLKATAKSNDPKTLEAEFTQAQREAAMESDPERRRELYDYAEAVRANMIAMKQAASGTKIDAAAVADMPRVQVPGMQRPALPGGARAQPTSPASGASASPTPGANGYANETNMADTVRDMVAKFNTPAEMQDEITKTQRLLPTMNEKDKPVAQAYMQELQRKLGSSNKPQRTVTRTGTINGKKVIQYSDGTIEYGN